MAPLYISYGRQGSLEVELMVPRLSLLRYDDDIPPDTLRLSSKQLDDLGRI